MEFPEGNWVDVNVRLPKKEARYECRVEVGSVSRSVHFRKVLFRKSNGGYFLGGDWSKVTHWREE